MLRGLTAWLTRHLFKSGRVSGLFLTALYLVFVSPVVLMAALSYLKTDRDLTRFTLSRRQTLAYLAATTLRADLDRLSDIGISLATRVRFRQLVRERRWEEAIEIMEDVPADFPSIERVFLADPRGTLRADMPALPGVRGKDFSFRDWYQGVSRSWKPYISAVYSRSAESRHNVFALAVPVRADTRQVVGILVLQVRPRLLLEWTRNIDAGPSGYLYIVDREGHAAAHPGYPPDEEIVDLSGLPSVQRVLRGERGAEVLVGSAGREDLVSAYEPIAGHGWGVVVEQPTAEAFATRDHNLWLIVLAYGAIVLFSGVSSYLVLRIIVERKRAEEERAHAQAFLDSVIENIPDMVFVKDAETLRFVRLNKAGEELLGLSREEMVGKSDEDFFPSEEAAFFTGKDRSVLENRILVDIPEEPIQTKTMGIRILHTKKVPILSKDGEPQYLLGISEDITERKEAQGRINRLNEALRQHAVQLEAANKELEAFSYSVSHDLRAPLRHMSGFARLLDQHAGAALDDTGRRYLRAISSSAKRMGDLIDDLLSFSRMSRTEIQKTRVSLPELVEAVVKDLEDEAKGRRVDWRIDPLPEVQGDPAMLRQVFLNLISNALKYTRPRPEARIEIGADSPAGETVIFVRDNGVGFDMQYAANLFGVFQRLHSADEFEGTGIGLATVRRIVHRHGGRTWAEAQVGKGAAFYLALPKNLEAAS